MALLYLFEDGHRAQLRRGGQHRHHLGVEERDEGIGAATPADFPRVIVDTTVQQEKASPYRSTPGLCIGPGSRWRASPGSTASRSANL